MSMVTAADIPTQHAQAPTRRMPGSRSWNAVRFRRDCADRAQCDGGLVCIEDATQVNSSYHCVTPPPECSGPATCDCFAASVCVTPFTVCSDGPQGSLICTCQDC